MISEKEENIDIDPHGIESTKPGDLPSDEGTTFSYFDGAKMALDPLISAHAESATSAEAKLAAVLKRRQEGSAIGDYSWSLSRALSTYSTLIENGTFMEHVKVEARKMEAEAIAAAPNGITVYGTLGLISKGWLNTYVKQAKAVNGSPLYLALEPQSKEDGYLNPAIWGVYRAEHTGKWEVSGR